MMMNKKRSSKLELGKYAFILPVLIMAGITCTVHQAEAKIEKVVINTVNTNLSDIANKVTEVLVKELKPLVKDTLKPVEVKGKVTKSLKQEKEIKVPPKTKEEIVVVGYPSSKGNDLSTNKFSGSYKTSVLSGGVLSGSYTNNNISINYNQNPSSEYLQFNLHGNPDKLIYSLDGKRVDLNSLKKIKIRDISHVYIRDGEKFKRKYGSNEEAAVEVTTKSFNNGENINKKIEFIGNVTNRTMNEDDFEDIVNSIKLGRYMFNSAKPPLYILDGKTIESSELSNFSHNDFEKVSVLKEDAGKAIYGDKGKNGVILITTKANASENPATNITDKGEPSKESIQLKEVTGTKGTPARITVKGEHQKDSNK